MAERAINISLQAQVTNFLANMEAASKSTKKVEDSLEAQKRASIEAARKQGEAAATLGRGVVAFGAVAAAGVAIAIAKFAEFDAKMSQVKALSHATASEMESLRTAALHMGQGIGFSATQVADAETELVKAGVGVKDMLGGSLVGALNLAAAGQINVGEATQIAAVAMTQFKLSGKDVPHLADLLAAGADKALGGVDQLGQALNQGGLVAAQFGLSIDDTVGTMSAFANAGLLGSDAGTSFKTMLLSLASPSQKAKDELHKYNIEAYDAQGHFVGITNLAGQLHDKLGDVSDAERNAALSTIFGTDAIRTANVLYQEGAKGLQSWIDRVNDSGFAAEQAAAKMDNLKGDVSKLGAAIDTGLIESGGGANEVLRTLVQGATAFATGISNLPAPVLAVGLGITAIVAATALMGGGFLTVVPKIAAAKVALIDLNVSGKTLAAGFGKGGAVLAALTLFSIGMAGAGSTAELTTDQLSKLNGALKAGDLKDLNEQFKSTDDRAINASAGVSGFRDALDALTSSDFSKNLQGNKNVGGFFDSITFGAANVSGELKKFEAQFKQMGVTLAATAKDDFPTAVDQFNKYVKAAGGGKEATKQLLETMPDYAASLRDLAADQGKTLTQQQLLNLATGKGALAHQLARDAAAKDKDSIVELGASAEDAQKDVDSLAESIKGFGSAQLDVNATQRDFQAAIDEASKSLKDNGKTLDINTEAGRANQASLDNIAEKALAAAAAIVEQTKGQDNGTAAIQAGRDALIAQLAQYGITGQAAEEYANKVGLIPGNVTTTIGFSGIDAALVEAARIRDALASIQRNVDIAVKINGAQNLATTGGIKVRFASGGMVPGAPSHKDNMVATVASGEFITRTAQAQIPANRAALEYMNAGGVIRGYASGGYVGGSYAAPQYARTSGGGQTIVNVTVPVSAGVVGNEDFLAKTVVRAVSNAAKNGAIPRGWNV